MKLKITKVSIIKDRRYLHYEADLIYKKSLIQWINKHKEQFSGDFVLNKLIKELEKE